MNFITESHRYGLEFLDDQIRPNEDWLELKEVLQNISDNDLIDTFESHGDRRGKSISIAINELIDLRLVEKGWNRQPHIFNRQDPNHPDPTSKYFRLDFAKNDLAVEVAFNHGEAVSWNLLKPVLSSELNHIEKEYETKIGIVVCATEEMKSRGGFDGAVATFDKYKRYLISMNTQLVTPLVIVGLEAPETFKVVHEQLTPTKKIGNIEKFENN